MRTKKSQFKVMQEKKLEKQSTTPGLVQDVDKQTNDLPFPMHDIFEGRNPLEQQSRTG